MASTQADRGTCRSSDLLLALVNTRANANGRRELLADDVALAQWLVAVQLSPSGPAPPMVSSVSWRS